jgi:hypothetical protein
MRLELAAHHDKCIDRAHRRYLSAIKALALVRRLALPVLVAQVNVAQQANGRNGEAQSREGGRHPRRTPGACTCPADRPSPAVGGESLQNQTRA